MHDTAASVPMLANIHGRGASWRHQDVDAGTADDALVRASARLCGCRCATVCEQLRASERASECVCVRERECESVCVLVCVRSCVRADRLLLQRELLVGSEIFLSSLVHKRAPMWMRTHTRT